MAQTVPLEVLRSGAAPPCLAPGGMICRGCPGWQAMVQALGPLGSWRGAIIHCSVTGLTARARPEP